MDFYIFSFIAIFTSCIASSSSSCQVRNYITGCRYEVKCSMNSGSVSNSNCDYEPYVTFVIVDSNQNSLAAGFFAATNFDSRVRELKAVNNSWITIEASTFRYYTKCLSMDLSNNNIKKVNTEAFRSLVDLKFLNLSHNNIESFHSRSFFIADTKHSLRELDLSNNKLQYLSTELNNIPELKILHLQNNQLTSLSDDAFMKLRDLSQLYLQNNLLSSVNLSLINLKSLEYLDISYNNIMKLSGYEINRLVAIVNFNVSHNQLTSIESNCFELAFNLTTADFSFNNIKIAIKNNMFVHNKKLNYLNFYNNNIFGLQENVFDNCNLTYLNLTNNNITGDINENTFSNLRFLSRLDLSKQSFTGIKNNAFVDMDILEHLNLSRNIISDIEYLSFINTSIAVLDLSYNKISNLNFLRNGLFNLTALYINDNNITVLYNYTFNNQTLLKILDLSKNNIIRIEENSLPLNNLQYLNIIGNKINGDIKANVFSPAKFLRFLDLSYFNISNVNSLAFDALPVLAKLNLSNNHIEFIDKNSFRNVDNLYNLDISYNELKEFGLNSTQLPNLRALYIRNNKLTDISRLILNQSKLTYLDLSNNDIEDVSCISHSIVPDLTVLYLNNNRIKNFNNVKTNSLSTLIDLRLSSNRISEIDLSYFKDLLSVELSNNNLTHINKTLLQENVYLQSLDLSRNKIIDLPPGTFQFMKNLKLVNLSSNYLPKLRYGSLKGLHKTEILDLSKNIITFLDVDIFHECEELKTLIIDYNRIKTFDVERLILVSVKKLKTLSLGGNPIQCREIVHSIKSTNITFYAVRQVEVTSIDKIYHEDNVHGIKCGDDPDPVSNNTIEVNPEKLPQDNNVSSTINTAVLIWCLAITVLLIIGGVILYKKRVSIIYRTTASRSLQESVYQSDLLG